MKQTTATTETNPMTIVTNWYSVQIYTKSYNQKKKYHNVSGNIGQIKTLLRHIHSVPTLVTLIFFNNLWKKLHSYLDAFRIPSVVIYINLVSSCPRFKHSGSIDVSLGGGAEESSAGVLHNHTANKENCSSSLQVGVLSLFFPVHSHKKSNQSQTKYCYCEFPFENINLKVNHFRSPFIKGLLTVTKYFLYG